MSGWIEYEVQEFRPPTSPRPTAWWERPRYGLALVLSDIGNTEFRLYLRIINYTWAQHAYSLRVPKPGRDIQEWKGEILRWADEIVTRQMTEIEKFVYYTGGNHE